MEEQQGSDVPLQEQRKADVSARSITDVRRIVVASGKDGSVLQ
jgi:hypothetical protein